MSFVVRRHPGLPSAIESPGGPPMSTAGVPSLGADDPELPMTGRKLRRPGSGRNGAMPSRSDGDHDILLVLLLGEARPSPGSSWTRRSAEQRVALALLDVAAALAGG